MKTDPNGQKGHRMLLEGHRGEERAHCRSSQGKRARRRGWLPKHKPRSTIKSYIKIRFFLKDCRWAGLSGLWLCSKNNRAAGMPRGHFHWKECAMFMKTQRSAERSIYFLDNSAESIPAPFPLCPSLNSHPFVCHRVYLYITNLHQG